PRHRDEVSERCTRGEKSRRRKQKRQKRVLLLRIQAWSDEPPQLRCDDRKAHHQGGEQRDLYLGEESLEHVCVNELSLAGAEQGLHEDREDRPREMKADEKGHDQGDEAPQEPPPEFDQMLQERLLGVVDVLHGSGRWSTGSSSPGCLSSNGNVGSAASARGGITWGWPGSG